MVMVDLTSRIPCPTFVIYATQIVEICHILQLLDAFVKFRKTTISVVTPVCPSVRPHGKLGCHWTDSREI
jgi:hypothetical protein